MIYYWVRNVGWALAGIVLGWLIGSVLLETEESVLLRVVYPVSGMDLRVWLDGFRVAAVRGLATALAGAGLWHMTAFVGTSRRSGRRALWALLWGVSLAGALVFWFVGVPATERGAPWPFIFCLMDAAVVFWIATVFFSPAPFKFTPVFASSLRRW